VSFNLFAATEPSTNVCVAHGALCNCETVILLQPHRTVVVNFVPGNFSLFQRNPWQPLAEPLGSVEAWLKNTAIEVTLVSCKI